MSNDDPEHFPVSWPPPFFVLHLVWGGGYWEACSCSWHKIKAMIHTQFFVHVCACAFISVNNVYLKKSFSHCLFETDKCIEEKCMSRYSYSYAKIQEVHPYYPGEILLMQPFSCTCVTIWIDAVFTTIQGAAQNAGNYVWREGNSLCLGHFAAWFVDGSFSEYEQILVF